jgi:cytochrome c oxidase subunit 3
MTSQHVDVSWNEAGTYAESQQRDDVVQLGVWMFLATVLMLFAAFSSAYIVRRTASDWTPIDLPRILWLNTAILVASSLALEGGRRARARDHMALARSGLLVTIGLGFMFLVGQLAGWRELVSRGVYLPTSPHSAFVYILTGIHGVHVLAGLLLLIYTVTKTWSPGRTATRLMTASATFWHFLAVLWLYVCVLVAAF